MELVGIRTLLQSGGLIGTKAVLWGGIYRLGQPRSVRFDFHQPAILAAVAPAMPWSPAPVATDATALIVPLHAAVLPSDLLSRSVPELLEANGPAAALAATVERPVQVAPAAAAPVPPLRVRHACARRCLQSEGVAGASNRAAQAAGTDPAGKGGSRFRKRV